MLPIVSVRSPRRLTPAKNVNGAPTLQGRAWACADACSHRRNGSSFVCGALSSSSLRGLAAQSGRFDLEDRWQHHDRLARTRDLGSGRAGAVWSIRGPQKSSVPNDLALALAPAADEPADRTSAIVVRFTIATSFNSGTAQTGCKKGNAFLLQGNRLYWFLTILAATAIASVIVGRMMIASGAGPGLTH